MRLSRQCCRSSPSPLPLCYLSMGLIAMTPVSMKHSWSQRMSIAPKTCGPENHIRPQTPSWTGTTPLCPLQLRWRSVAPLSEDHHETGEETAVLLAVFLRVPLLGSDASRYGRLRAPACSGLPWYWFPAAEFAGFAGTTCLARCCRLPGSAGPQRFISILNEIAHGLQKHAKVAGRGLVQVLFGIPAGFVLLLHRADMPLRSFWNGGIRPGAARAFRGCRALS